MVHKTLPLYALLLLSCCGPQQPHPPGPTPDVTGTEFCDEAEVNLEALECLNPDNTPMWVNADGERFADTCIRIQESGGIFVDPECIATAPTCEEANACPPSSL